MDYSAAVNSVAETIAKGSKPLTEAQRRVMAGAMAVWLEKARKDGLDWARSMAAYCKENGINYP
jgi:hypothetical protein